MNNGSIYMTIGYVLGPKGHQRSKIVYDGPKLETAIHKASRFATAEVIEFRPDGSKRKIF